MHLYHGEVVNTREMPTKKSARAAPVAFRGWLAAAVALAIGIQVPAARSDALARLESGEPLRIGVANERPYGYIDDSGELAGEAPTIARHILESIDPQAELEAVTVDFGQLIPGLRAERIDIAAAGMFITPERCRRVAFSEPTYVVGEAFAVKAGNPKNITDYASISDNRDARAGLISGTVEYNYAVVAGIPAERALLYNSFEEAINALRAGEVDAVGMTALTVRTLLRDTNDTELTSTRQFFPVVDGEVTKGYGAFAFRKEDRALLEAFNRRLKSFIGTEAHWAMVAEYGFGPDMAPDKSTAALCGG